jgi:flagellar biosynthetic protein FliR
MYDILQFTVRDLELFLLVLMRMGALFLTAPVFGSGSIPAPLKAALSMILTMILFPVINIQSAVLPESSVGLAVLILKELTVGVAVGFAATFAFQGLQLAGGLISRQMGLDMAEMLDPVTELEVPVVGQYLVLLGTVIFLVIDGHHWLLQAMAESFRMIPLTQMRFAGEFLGQLLEMSRNIFITGIKVGAPVFISLFLLTVILGVLSRVVPQMHIFSVGFPLKVLSGFLLMVFFLDFFLYCFEKVFVQLHADVELLIRCLA